MMSFTSISGIQIDKNINILFGRGNILYVGGSGPGNYTTIQSAIDEASNGDTIFVYSGYYEESVKINKSVELFGEDKNNTIISSNDRKFVVDVDEADNFKIHGFKIMSSRNGISIFWSDNSHIYDNKIQIDHYTEHSFPLLNRLRNKVCVLNLFR